MSFFIGLTPGGCGITIKDIVVFKDNSYTKASKGGILTLPFVLGYMFKKGRFQTKVDASINIWPWAKDVNFLSLRDVGCLKVFFGYALTQRFTLSGGLGINITSINKFRLAENSNWYNVSAKAQKSELSTLITPFIGADLQYQIHPSWYMTANLHIGHTLWNRKANGALLATQKITISDNPIKEIEAGNVIPEGEKSSLTRCGFVGRFMIGVLYELGGSK